MARVSHISGIDEIIRNLKRIDTQIARGVARGLKRGGQLLLRESQKIVPVDKGPLKASGFDRNVGGSGFKTDIIVGFTAVYAVYVHEDLDAAHGAAFNEKYGAILTDIVTKTERREQLRGPNQQAKFLEQPARDLRPVILKIIHQEAKK